MKRSKTMGSPREPSAQQIQSASGTAINLARALFDDGKHLKGINVIAPNLQVHVHVGQ